MFFVVLFAFIGMVVPAALGVCVDFDVFVYRVGCRTVTIVFAYFVSIDAPSPHPPRPRPSLAACGVRACVVCGSFVSGCVGWGGVGGGVGWGGVGWGWVGWDGVGTRQGRIHAIFAKNVPGWLRARWTN